MNKKIPFSPPDISELEIENVTKVLKSGWLTTGPKTKELELELSKYCDTKKAICLSSATACMELCLRMLGVGPGDEVITTAYTYTASASVINHVGAQIVLVDTDKDSYQISYDGLEKAITSKTKVIIPVDIAGVMCDYDRIFQILEEKKKLFKPRNEIQSIFNRVIVLADAAHSFGAKYKMKKSGNVADFTSFSFHAVKNLTTAEGGALTWKDLGKEVNDEIYNNLNISSLHGQTKDALTKNNLGSWEYDVIYPAFKCNMTDIQAAIGLGQLGRYEEILRKRKSLVVQYKKWEQKIGQLEIINHQLSNVEDRSSSHLLLTRLPVSLEKRNELIYSFAQHGIATNVHYKPLPLLTAYKNLGFKIEDYPNSFKQYCNEITLPLYQKLTVNEVDYIMETLKKLMEG